MLGTVSSDTTKFEQALLIQLISALLMATEDFGIPRCIMCTMPLQSARSKGSIHR